jgi:hypothetical protein
MGESTPLAHGPWGRLGSRTRRAALIGAAATAAAASAALIGSTGAPASSPSAGASGADCTYRTHVTAIIDDSASTAGTDPFENRDAFIDLFVAADLLAGGPTRDLAAVEFGTTAKTIFGPTPINTANEGMIRQKVDAATKSDENTTNYNAAFGQANAVDPSVNKALNSQWARIFLTDGEHNVGPYTNGHLPGPRTEVVGLNVSTAAGQALLDKIAGDTGGTHISLDNPAELIPASIRVFADLSCLQLNERSTKLPAPGKSKTVITEKLGKAKEASVTLSLSGVDAEIGIVSFQIGERKGIKHNIKSTARQVTSAAKDNCKDKKKSKKGKKGKPKLRVSCAGSDSFLTMQLKVKKGKALKRALGKKLKVKVKTPKTILFPSTARITGQVTTN